MSHTPWSSTEVLLVLCLAYVAFSLLMDWLISPSPTRPRKVGCPTHGADHVELVPTGRGTLRICAKCGSRFGYVEHDRIDQSRVVPGLILWLVLWWSRLTGRGR